MSGEWKPSPEPSQSVLEYQAVSAERIDRVRRRQAEVRDFLTAVVRGIMLVATLLAAICAYTAAVFYMGS